MRLVLRTGINISQEFMEYEALSLWELCSNMSPGVWDGTTLKMNEEYKAKMQGVLCGQLKLCFPLSGSSLAHFSLSLCLSSPLGTPDLEPEFLKILALIFLTASIHDLCPIRA